jgi:pyruvate dehydrogenase E2 component (dihydrolipoamide acetyltransferase)
VAEFKLPELGENIAAGDLVRLMIAPGDTVAEGQPVMELETDKAVIEVPSTVAGTIKEVKVKQGQKLKVGEVIFTTENGAKAAPAPAAPAQPATPKQEAAPQQAAPAPAPPERPKGAAAPPPPKELVQAQPETIEEPGSSTRELAAASWRMAAQAEGKTEAQALPPDKYVLPVRQEVQLPPSDQRGPAPASPSVRRLARELGIDIHAVRASGEAGRISEEDIKAYVKGLVTSGIVGGPAPAGAPFAQPTLPDFSKWGTVERESMRGVRRKTAVHLSQAWNTIPHVTQHDKADVTGLEELRKKYSAEVEKSGGKLTVTAIILKIIAAALKKFPQFNSSVDLPGEAVIYKQYYNVGIAVDTDRGLLVPVIKDVDKKNVTQLAADLAQISKKARDKKLTPEEMEGGTFTITNLGGIGGTSFTPIVNHPEVAIVGMSRSRMEPVWNGKEFEPRLMLPLSLSYDHRIIDGADAARFLRWVVEALEEPFVMALNG